MTTEQVRFHGPGAPVVATPMPPAATGAERRIPGVDLAREVLPWVDETPGRTSGVLDRADASRLEAT